MHTFDPRMIEMMMMMRTSIGVLVKTGANGDNDNYCSIFLQSSASSSLRDVWERDCRKQGSRRAKQTLAQISPFLTSSRWQQVADPRCDLSFRLQKAPTSFQAPDPSFRLQAVGPRLWRPLSRPRSKLWRPKASGMS